MRADDRDGGAPDVSGSGRNVTLWLAGALFLAAVVFLLADATARGRQHQERSLSRLLDDARTASARLERVLLRVSGELETFARFTREMGQSEEVLVAELDDHLSDLGNRILGVAVFDSAGEVLAGRPTPMPEVHEPIGREISTRGFSLDSTTVVQTDGALPDGRPFAAMLHRLEGREGESGQVLAVLLFLGPWPASAISPGAYEDPVTVFLLDSDGTILYHPRRDWIGLLILSPADSLYDPELYDLLPRILGEDDGAWILVSEVLFEGSWMKAQESLLATSPVSLPDGGSWRLGLTTTPEESALSGIPSVVRVGGIPLLVGLLLMATAFLLSVGRGWTRRARTLRRRTAWYETLLEAGPDGLLVLDGTHRVVAVNDTFSRLTGRSAKEVLGVSVNELLDLPGSTDEAADPVVIPRGRTELKLLGKEGDVVNVEANTGTFEVGGETYSLSTMRDVGWRNRMERETLRVAEKERLLVGKELHDGLAQHLTGIGFLSATLTSKLIDQGAEGAREAERISRLVRDGVGQIRVLSKGLELSELSGEELPEALEEMAGVVRRIMGVDLRLDVALGREPEGSGMSSMEATQIFRLCHDLVSDAVKKRLASRIRISLREGTDRVDRVDRVDLVVRHDGREAGPERVEDTSPFAFRLRYRARLLDAMLDGSEEDGWTVTRCSFRLGREARHD